MKIWKILLPCAAIALLWIAVSYFNQTVQKTDQKTGQYPRRAECGRETKPYRMRRARQRLRKLTAVHADGMVASSLRENGATTNSTASKPKKTKIPRPTPTSEAEGTPAPESHSAEDKTENANNADPTPAPFVIVNTVLPAAFVGASYSASLVADGGEAPYVWSVPDGALPKGLSLDANKGIVSGIPQEPGIVQLTLTATDATEHGVSASCTLEVREQGGILVPAVAGLRSTPLYLVTGSLPEAKVGEAYHSQFAATGGAPPYLWSIQAGRLPDGIAIDRYSGALSGISSSPQTESFQVKVTDSNACSDIAEHRINVVGPDIAITTSYLGIGMVGSSYEQRLNASGGTPPYVWSLSSGALPDGLSLDTTGGRIFGTPVEQFEAVITLGVTDGQGASARESLELVVDSPGLTIVTDNLPTGELDKPYEAGLTADGGAPPYTWALTGGHLPPNLDFNTATGVLSGTPSDEAGDYPLTFSVTDQEESPAQRSLTLSITESSAFAATKLNTTPSDGKVGLTWTNPTAKDYSHTIVIRNTKNYPSGAEDGVVIYSGNGNSFLDKELPNGVPCYYAAIPYTSAGAPGTIVESSRACAMPQQVNLSGPANPFADAVASFRPLSSGGFGSGNISCVLGPPAGGGIMHGSTHVVSLHARANDDEGASPPYGGSITLQFSDNIVVNGPGPDFVIFENVFYAGGNPQKRWMEPAIVSVSRDGSRYYTFPYDFVPHYNDRGEINCYNPYCYSRGFAGINPVFSNGGSPDPRVPSAGGGDAFDLSSLNQPSLDWIRYVRITATGDNWLTDMNGDRVRHATDTGACSGGGSSGFDLDAICAINY